MATVTRPSGVVVSDTGCVEASRALRGRSAIRSREDALIAHHVDEAGCLDTFGLDGSATIDVPADCGPCALLVQDLASGRWRWQLAGASSAGDGALLKRFRVDAADTANEPAAAADPSSEASDERARAAGTGSDVEGMAAKVFVKVVSSAGGSRVTGRDANLLAHHWERMHRPSTLRWHGARLGLHDGDGPSADDLGGPSLLLLHDVFATTASGFPSGLDGHRWPERYGDRVWGFDHATISQGPAENAARLLELVGTLGQHSIVDILAHGRGGLVAAALAQDPRRHFPIATVVLAGTPLHGTPIFDADHLLALANRYTNMLSLVPDNPVTSTLDAVIALVMQLAHDTVPALSGLVAMAEGITGDPFREARSVRHLAGRFVVPDRMRARIADRVLDGLLGAGHDLVVPLSSACSDEAESVEVVEASHRSLLQGPGGRVVSQWLSGEGERSDDGGTRAESGGLARPAREFKVVPRSTGESRASPPITVAVHHGGIENAAGLAIVGHFLGTELTGTEAALDARLDGKLAVRQLARQYPEREGEWHHVDRARGERPAGVLVVGLGAPGALTRSSLTETVRNALARYGFSRSEAGAPPAQVSISAALIGTAEGAAVSLPVEISVAAVVDAVIAANQSLREMVDSSGRNVSEVVSYDAVNFVELYADKAALAMRSARELSQLVADADGAPPAAVLESRYLVAGGGGRPARLAAEEDPGWMRVVVEAVDRPGDVSLRFTSIGGRALTNDAVMSPNRAVVDELLRDAVGGWSARAAMVLTELIVPAELRAPIGAADNLQLIVDAASARYPWEVLIAARGVTPAALGRRGGLIRQFRSIERERPGGHRMSGQSALVIGAPPTGDAALPALWGAAAECHEVVAELERHDYRVTALLDLDSDPCTSAGRVIEALALTQHRVLHIAAHGVVVDDDADRTGVVIGPGAVLRAADIEQRENVPELVFLNCCGLGADPGLASNLARAFMNRGAQAVVAAGWEVDDEAARRFAVCLYRKLLTGSTFGASVRLARLEALRADPGSSTWAAYQCYGDPGFRLERPRRGAQPLGEMTSQLELVRQLQVISVKAADAGRRGDKIHEVVRRRLCHELVDVVAFVASDAVCGSWLDATAYAELASAAGELGDLDQAVDWYRKALTFDSARLSVRALEQLGNLEIRLAQQRHRADPDLDVADLVRSSRKHLAAALRIGDSVERRGLIGSHFKKLATMSGGDTRSKHLATAADQYRRGSEQKPTDSYTAFNHLQLARLHGDGDGGDGGVTDADATARIDALDHGSYDDYWQLVQRGDAELTRLVLDPTRPVTAVVEAYVRAFSFRSTWRERSSSLEHLRDLIDLAEQADLHDALVDVREDLLQWVRSELGQED